MATFEPGNPGRPKGSRNKPKIDRLAEQKIRKRLSELLGLALDAVEDELTNGTNRMRAAEIVLRKCLPDSLKVIDAGPDAPKKTHIDPETVRTIWRDLYGY